MTFISLCLQSDEVIFLDEFNQAKVLSIKQTLSSEDACEALPSNVLTIVTKQAAKAA